VFEQVIKGLSHYAVILNGDLVQDIGVPGSDYEISAPDEFAGEILSACVAEFREINPNIKFLRIEHPGAALPLDPGPASRAVVRPLDLKLAP
jgi:hypothetical protein